MLNRRDAILALTAGFAATGWAGRAAAAAPALSWTPKALTADQAQLLDVVAEGDLVVARYIERGTHSGAAYGSHPASGRAYEKHGFGMYRVVDGRMTFGAVQEDDVAFARALGWDATPLA